MDADRTAEIFTAADQARSATKLLLKSMSKYRDASQVECDNAMNVFKQLQTIYSADWIYELANIDVAKYLRYFGSTFVAVNSLKQQMVTDLAKIVLEPLENFTNYDFIEMYNAKKKMAATASEYEGMRTKIETAMINQSKKGRKKKEGPQDMQILVEQWTTELSRLQDEQTQNQTHLSNVLIQTHQKKEIKLLTSMSKLLQLQFSFHDKSHKILSNLQQKMAELQPQLDESQRKLDPNTREGHLQKNSGSGWSKYWFVLKDGILNCYKSKDSTLEQSLNIMYCTTRIPLTKSKNGNENVFELVTSGSKKPWLLQAESEGERNDWVNAIQEAIEIQLNLNDPSIPVDAGNDSMAMDILKSPEGNNVCADCGAPDPEWASINLGILVCLNCSGVHRNLGTHISKVRSTTLDTRAWEPELIAYMIKIGNARFNEIYEEKLSSNSEFMKPIPAIDRTTREKYIRAKYADKLFVKRSGKFSDALAMDIYDTIHKEGDYTLDIFRNIVDGANLDWNNPNDGFLTPVHYAVFCNRPDYLEMFVLNGCSLFCREARDWTPMHFAAYHNREQCAYLLYKHGAQDTALQATDCENFTPVDIAETSGYSDIVAIMKGEKKPNSVTMEELFEQTTSASNFFNFGFSELRSSSSTPKIDMKPPSEPAPLPPTTKSGKTKKLKTPKSVPTIKSHSDSTPATYTVPSDEGALPIPLPLKLSESSPRIESQKVPSSPSPSTPIRSEGMIPPPPPPPPLMSPRGQLCHQLNWASVPIPAPIASVSPGRSRPPVPPRSPRMNKKKLSETSDVGSPAPQ